MYGLKMLSKGTLVLTNASFEHLLATAAADVGNVALQVLVPLERRLPHPLLGLHARLGPKLHGGRLVLVIAPTVMLLGEPPLGTPHPAHEVSHPTYAVAAVTHGMEATSTMRAAATELESKEGPEKTTADPDATVMVPSASAAVSATVFAGRPSGSGA